MAKKYFTHMDGVYNDLRIGVRIVDTMLALQTSAVPGEGRSKDDGCRGGVVAIAPQTGGGRCRRVP